jgi:hypothetical protein
MSKVNPRESMEVLMLKLRAPKKTSKLMLSFKELRCEGVNFNALDMFFKDILAHVMLHIFCGIR